MDIAAKLHAYLTRRMPLAGNLKVANLSRIIYGASRDTFAFDICWEENGAEREQGLVLRRDPPTGLLDHISRQTEFRILKSLEGSGIPVPEAFWCETDPDILERPFIIMERIEGLVTRAFQVVGGSNQSYRRRIAEDFVSILARIHNLDWRERGLDFLGEPHDAFGYAKQTIAKWEAILKEVMFEPDLILTEALIWLKDNIYPNEEICLIHGDYKSDNLMCAENEIVAVFDWEMASLGDPHDDLGWVCMEYYSVDGLINGLMKRDWFLQRYEELSGRRVDPTAVKFWQVLSNVKMAAISLTALHRYVSGGSEKNVMAVLPLLMPKLHQDIIALLEF